ncbi:MAG: hypothetical protein MR602_01810 [Bacteroidales bacterium]|nr:hypothetical protein [Bacteroidales bacterium]
MLLTEWCKKGFHLLIFYQPSVPHLKFPSTQIIVDFLQKAVSIMYTVFSFKKEHGRCFQPKSLLRRSKSRALVSLVAVVSRTANTKSAVDDFVK